MALLGLVGCDPEANSGADAQRGGATAIELESPVVDDISASDGDKTDWKSFELESAGAITVTFGADDPEAEIRLGVYDKFAQALATAVRDKDSPTLELVAKPPEPGLYFRMIQAESGETTTYTVEITLGAEGEGPGRPDF